MVNFLCAIFAQSVFKSFNYAQKRTGKPLVMPLVIRDWLISCVITANKETLNLDYEKAAEAVSDGYKNIKETMRQSERFEAGKNLIKNESVSFWFFVRFF